MSLITSCPACGTLFRVVPDQLKISDGWVRCGHCGEVFDATAHLHDEAELDRARAQQARAAEGRPPEMETRPADMETRPADMATTPAALPQGLAVLPHDAGPLEPDAPGADAPEAYAREAYVREAEAGEADAGELDARPAAPAADAPETEDEAEVEEAGTSPAALSPAGRPGAPDGPRPRPPPAPPSSFFGPDSQSLEPSPLDSPFVFHRSDLVERGEIPSVLPPPPDGEPTSGEHAEQEEPTPAELEGVSFVRQARRRAFWRRPLVRFVLALAALGLAALLALQLAWQDRDRLALAEPALRPALQEMCRLLDCTLGPPRQIESVVIESSGFSRLRDDTYRVAFTLRNGASVPVAVPAMELTITDAQDQPIVRRVLLPSDFGAAGEALPALGEWSRAIGVAVDPPAGARVAGYRLLAFYP